MKKIEPENTFSRLLTANRNRYHQVTKDTMDFRKSKMMKVRRLTSLLERQNECRPKTLERKSGFRK